MDGQEIAVLVTVLVAAGYLVRRGLRVIRGRSGGCGGCNTCPHNSTTNMPVRKELHQLGPRDRQVRS